MKLRELPEFVHISSEKADAKKYKFYCQVVHSYACRSSQAKQLQYITLLLVTTKE
jgi:hypothetical protein